MTLTGAWDSQEEARLIGEEIENLHVKKHRLSEIAVLVRISAQMREIEERFVSLGLPYRVIGGPRFYERAEIRDALAYLRCVVSDTDDLAFERIINVPKRGLGDATLQLLHNHARAMRDNESGAGGSLMRAARQMIETEELKPKVRQSLRELVDGFARWAAQAEAMPQSELAEIVLEESGYTDHWRKDRTADAAGRLENLKELTRTLEEFPDLPAFLEHVSLVMDRGDGESEDKVSLMTLHAAKGLEFDTVFLPGWEEGFSPTSARSMRMAARGWRKSVGSRMSASPAPGNAPGSCSPRTGASMACGNQACRAASSMNCRPPMSRSRRRRRISARCRTASMAPRALTAWALSAPATARRAGSARRRTRPAHKVAAGLVAAAWRSRSTGSFGGAASVQPARRGPMLIEGEVLARSAGATSSFSAGERCFHVKFGPGTVIAIDGNKLTVDFDKAGRKMVLESFVQRG